MQVTNKKLILFIGLLLASQLCGCTNWKKKYKALNVEHQNTLGLLERERAEKSQLAQQSQQTIEELQRQIAERNQTPAQSIQSRTQDKERGAHDGKLYTRE